MQTILVNNFHDSSGSICAPMITFNNPKPQDVRVEHPVIWFVWRHIDVMGHDRQIWVISLGCPGVEHDQKFTWAILGHQLLIKMIYKYKIMK